MTFQERLDDYEKSCIYGTAKMREAAIKRGDILPNTDRPDEMDWHREWLERTLAALGDQS